MALNSMAVVAALLMLSLVITGLSSQCLSENDSIRANSPSKYNSGHQSFTLELLHALQSATPNESVFFSPHSTYHALLLAYFGARNATEAALKKTLKLDWAQSKAEVMQAYQLERQNRVARSQNRSVEFNSIDKIFIAKDVQLRECMQKVLGENIKSLNFIENSEESRQEINSFVEETTKGNIKDLLVPGSITEATKLVLANAAYFKGQWASKFDSRDTKKDVFYESGNHQVLVDMMMKKGTYNYAPNEKLNCVVLEIPYLGEDDGISMVVFLPTFVPNAVEDLIQRLTPELLEEALEDGISREVEIKFPKISFEKTYEFTPILRQLGVGNLFDASADFSGFSEKEHLNLDDAIHKAKIEIDEEGSTAAAATVLFSFRSSRPLEPAQFFCNHPFLFMIYDRPSQGILFAGVYKGPSK